MWSSTNEIWMMTVSKLLRIVLSLLTTRIPNGNPMQCKDNPRKPYSVIEKKTERRRSVTLRMYIRTKWRSCVHLHTAIYVKPVHRLRVCNSLWETKATSYTCQLHTNTKPRLWNNNNKNIYRIKVSQKSALPGSSDMSIPAAMLTSPAYQPSCAGSPWDLQPTSTCLS